MPYRAVAYQRYWIGNVNGITVLKRGTWRSDASQGKSVTSPQNFLLYQLSTEGTGMGRRQPTTFMPVTLQSWYQKLGLYCQQNSEHLVYYVETDNIKHPDVCYEWQVSESTIFWLETDVYYKCIQNSRQLVSFMGHPVPTVGGLVLTPMEAWNLRDV